MFTNASHSQKSFTLAALALLLTALILAACASKATPAPSGIANPASENCINKGGQLKMEKAPSGGEYGVCIFEDNRQCEEWAMFRGDCPEGGIKITGYVTPAAVYCAITGGEYQVTGQSKGNVEEGTCTFKSGKTCDVWEYYNGKCAP